MSCCPISRTCASLRGPLLGFGEFGGGHGRGFGFLGGGGGFAGEALRGLGGLNPQLNSRISSSAQPSHPNSPRLA